MNQHRNKIWLPKMFWISSLDHNHYVWKLQSVNLLPLLKSKDRSSGCFEAVSLVFIESDDVFSEKCSLRFEPVMLTVSLTNYLIWFTWDMLLCAPLSMTFPLFTIHRITLLPQKANLPVISTTVVFIFGFTFCSVIKFPNFNWLFTRTNPKSGKVYLTEFRVESFEAVQGVLSSFWESPPCCSKVLCKCYFNWNHSKV